MSSESKGQSLGETLLRFLGAGTPASPPPPEFGSSIPHKDFLTLQEAAPHLGYKHVESFRRVIREGRSPVPIKEIGRRKYVTRVDLVAYLWRKS